MSDAINRQITLDRFGPPAEAARQINVPVPEPAQGQVLVRTQFAPINPADLNVLEGRYGKLPSLPAVIGNEGAGRVAALGQSVTHFSIGDPVLYLQRDDCWQDFVLAEPEQLLRLPDGLDPQVACMLKINPATAWLLLHQFAPLERGSWIVQNAANSGVGRAVIAIANAQGWRTVNFVRREELIPPLTASGADLVLLDDDEGKSAALEQIGATTPVPLALNAVGGESALRIMSMLADGGTHVTYGAMARRPLKIPNSFLIFKDLHIRGLWLSRWLDTAPKPEVETLYKELAQLMLDGQLDQPIDSIFKPERISDAIHRATQPSRSGKVLLDFRPAAGEGS